MMLRLLVMVTVVSGERSGGCTIGWCLRGPSSIQDRGCPTGGPQYHGPYLVTKQPDPPEIITSYEPNLIIREGLAVALHSWLNLE